MVRDRHKEAGGRESVARPQRGGKSRGDALESVPGGGVDPSGAHRGHLLLQISRHVENEKQQSLLFRSVQRLVLVRRRYPVRFLANKKKQKETRTLRNYIYITCVVSLYLNSPAGCFTFLNKVDGPCP